MYLFYLKNINIMGKKSIKTNFIIFIELFFLQQIKYINSLSCSANSPFIKNNECVSYCSTDELKKNCRISDNNSKLKQITNLIILGGKNYRLININSNLKNDLIIQVSEYSNYGERIFYGLKNNGRYLFKDENQKEYPISTFNIEGEVDLYQKNFGGESSFIKISNDNEFFINIAKEDQNTEIFNFVNNEYNSTKTKDFLEHNFYSDRGTFSFLSKDSNEKYYYLITGVYTNNSQYNCYMKKVYFTSNVLSEGSHFENLKEKKCAENKMLSCFMTALDKIICFYRDIDIDNLDYYCIIVYENKTRIGGVKLGRSESSNLFYKAVHLKEEIGVFIYFSSESDYYPRITFKQFDSENLSNIEDYKSYTNILLDKTRLRYDYMLNDIIKLSDNIICYGSVDVYKSGIALIILRLYNNDTKMNMKYYMISNKDIFHFLIYKEIKLSLFNNEYIAFGSSICFSDRCSNDEDEHNSSFLIFNYPNSTDVEIDLMEKIFEVNKEIDKIAFNLEEYTLIENNVFGYIVKGIKIINYPENMTLKSSKTQLKIKKNDILEHNDSFTLYFSSINKKYYIIEYALVATEDQFYNSKASIVYFDTTFGGDDELNFFGGDIYIGKTSYFTLKIDIDFLSADCLNNCPLCLSTDASYCLICQNNCSFQEDENKYEDQSSKPDSSLKIKASIISEHSQVFSDNPSLPQSNESYSAVQYPPFSSLSISSSSKLSPFSTTNSSSRLIPSSQLIPYSQLTYSSQLTPSSNSIIYNLLTNSSIIISSTSPSQLISSYPLINNSTSIINKIYECTEDQILTNACKEGKLTNEQLADIYNNIKENKVKHFNNKSTIIQTQNVIFQVSTIEQQKNNTKNISSVDLGECEEILKKSIKGFQKGDELIIYKTDIKYEERSSTYVHYEIYNPYSLEEMDLKICHKSEITINAPLYLSQNVEEKKENLEKFGYNIFDENDIFYNDICTKFTNEFGNDMILSDRRNDIYGLINNISLCQKGCTFQSYNSISKKAICNCEIKEKKNIIEELKDFTNIFEERKNIYEIFKNTISYSNFKILKCYKLLKNFKNFIHNYGCIIFLICLIAYFILMVKYFINDYKKINELIQSILQKKYFRLKKRKSIDDIKGKRNIHNVIDNIIITKKNRKKSKNIFKGKDNIVEPQRNNKIAIQKSINDSSIKKNILKSSSYFSNNISTIKFTNNNKKSKKKQKRNSVILQKSRKSLNPNSSNSIIKISSKKEPLNDRELNILKYDKAIILDKRTYFQFYCSLLKEKHIILFTFFQNNDYNILITKISLLILSISLYFSINGFFFNDESMHNLYIYNGKFIFIQQIAKIIYVSIISLIVQQILRILSMSDKYLLEFKQKKILKKAIEKSKSLHECLKKKIIIFYILGFLLMLFFWYFMTCFCAVYSNTQAILFKDTSLSFLFSLVYPFVLNLLPGIFRISALKSPKKDKECLFNFSFLVALF